MTNEPDRFSKDLYQTIDLWAGVNLGKRFQVLVLVPFNINKQENEEHAHVHKGLGDVMLIGNYKLLNKVNHQLLIGTGVKLPTGSFHPDPHHPPMPAASIEPGSGSVDFIVNVSDVISGKKWTLGTGLIYAVNGEAKEFQFGNSLNASALVSRRFSVFTPYAGLQYEQHEAMKFQNQQIADSKGRALNLATGVNITFKKWNVGMDLQTPLAQNIANKQTQAMTRGMLRFARLL